MAKLATRTLSQTKRSTSLSRGIDTLEISIEVEDNLQQLPESLRDLIYGEEYGTQPYTIMACASEGMDMHPGTVNDLNSI